MAVWAPRAPLVEPCESGYGTLAQLEEQDPLKVKVLGSIPRRPTMNNYQDISEEDISVFRMDEAKKEVAFTFSGILAAMEKPRMVEAIDRARERGVEIRLV